MSKLISEVDAFTAWKNGEDVEIYDESGCWHPLQRDHGLCVFDSNGRVKFRLKPKTITINGVDSPKPLSLYWDILSPEKVTVKFSSKNDALIFMNVLDKALK